VSLNCLRRHSVPRHQVSELILVPLGQSEKAMGLESPIESWLASDNRCACLFQNGLASSLICDETAREIPNRHTLLCVAGPTLQNERAEVRGLLHGVARKEFGLLVPIGSLTGHRSLYSIHGGRVGVAPTRSCSLPWGTHPLYLGAEFCNASPAPSHARRHAPWPAQLSKRNAPRCGSGVVTYFQTVLNSEQKCLPA